MNRLSLRKSVAVSIGAIVCIGSALAESPDFARQVRPILSTHCFKCHGPDEKARKAELRLDTRDEALRAGESGEPAVIPGNPEMSEIIRRIFSDDRDDIMPPPATKHELSAAQKEILKKWVAAGAEYRPHWAFAAPKAVDPPSVASSAIARNPIDQFVLAKLDTEKLTASPEADRIALMRRVSLDLSGLSPTPEQADAFKNDPSPDAYERLVDRLLESPHYGERWARKWLDLARYADTNGYEKDRNREIWPYRDWVIRALNADMPFDQFTIKQLAGDLLPNATTDDLIATGFHRNTMLNEEGGIDPLEFRYYAMVDRNATTGTTWLGLTVGCAQCHTHKYDPLLHNEYFGLMAFLNNTEEPDLALKDEGWEQRRTENMEKAAKLLAELPAKWPLEETHWTVAPVIKVVTGSGEEGKHLEDGSVLFAAPGPPRERYTFIIESNHDAPVEQLRLETLLDDSLPAKGPGRVQHGNFVLSEISVKALPADGSGFPVDVKIASAKADAEQANFPVTAAFDGKLHTGWAVHVKGKPMNVPKSATFRFTEPVRFPGGTRLEVTLDQNYGERHTIGRLRLSIGTPVADKRPLTERRAEAVDQAFAEWLRRERARTVRWTPLRPSGLKSNLPLLTVEPDASIYVSGDVTKYDKYEIQFSNVPAGATALRIEALADERLPGHGPGLAYYEGSKGDFLLTDLRLLAGDRQVMFADASHSYASASHLAKNAIDEELQTGWGCSDRLGENHQAAFILAEPFSGGPATLKLEFSRHYAAGLGRFRVSFTTATGAEAREIPPEIERLLSLPDDQLSAEHRGELRNHFLLTVPQLAAEAKRIRELRKPPVAQTTLVMRERPPENPRVTRLHHRGEWLQPAEEIQPMVPAFLPSLPEAAPKNRLTFARWLVSPENPLTARVTVNRQWEAFFGQGLVRTSADFGFQGEMPSHPELLDWLAIEFVKQGWSLKKLHRLIVTSATYRQSSQVSPDLLARDPQNRLLARGPRVRIEAEVVRDQALSASGLLSRKMFGPPVRPPQPEGVSEVAFGAPKWNVSEGEDRYRRGLYTFVKRSAPYAMFNTFDGPSGEVCVARREVSNTPLQALTLLNDTVFMEAAQAIGKKAAQVAGDDVERARYVFRRFLLREPTAAELDRVVTFAQKQRRRFEAGELDPMKVGASSSPEVAAWATLARAVMNLDEAVTRN
jgi:hypothetical protein